MTSVLKRYIYILIATLVAFVLFFVLFCLGTGDFFYLRPLWAEEESDFQPLPAENNDPSSLEIDYREVDIREVARAFSELSGINIIVSSDAQANVTVKMSGVDWRTALEVILDTYDLGYIEKEDFLIITTLARRRLQEESGVLETRILRFNFADVSSIRDTLRSILTTRGNVDVDTRTNSLIVTDIRDRLDEIERVASQLDMRTPQVLIEIMVMEVKLTDAFKWGVVETLATDVRPADATQRKWIAQTGSTLSVAGTPTFNWGKTIFKSADLNMTLQAIMTMTKSEILANPRVVTLDNLEAEINVVTQHPYESQTQTGEQDQPMSATSFLPVGITLTVTPHITKDNFVSMKIEAKHDVKTGTSGGVPVVDTRTASTNVLVRDGETIVMGGLRRRDVSDAVNKIPLLGDLPLLGNLFRSKDKSVTETELVIFVTPHLVGDALLTETEMLQLEQKKSMRGLSTEMISFGDKELLPLRLPSRAGMGGEP